MLGRKSSEGTVNWPCSLCPGYHEKTTVFHWSCLKFQSKPGCWIVDTDWLSLNRIELELLIYHPAEAIIVPQLWLPLTMKEKESSDDSTVVGGSNIGALTPSRSSPSNQAGATLERRQLPTHNLSLRIKAQKKSKKRSFRERVYWRHWESNSD